jgi:hypothetical protein
MGTVWVSEVTRSSVTLDWSDPRGSHELATAIPVYRVSWAAADADESVLLASATVVVGAASRPYTISGLDAGTYYQFRVEAHASRIDATGAAINPKYREIARIRQGTSAPPPAAALRLAGATGGSFHLELVNPDPAAFDVVRLAYKMKWCLDGELNAVARDPLGPSQAWGESDAVRGWIDVPSVGVARESIPPSGAGAPLQLAKRTGYEIVAYGFNIGDSEGTLLGNAQGQTSGSRPFASLEEAIATDHPAIVDRYSKLPTVPDMPIVEVVAASHPQIIGVKDLIMADHGDDLENDVTAVRFLIERMPDVLVEVHLAQGSDLPAFAGGELPGLVPTLPPEVGPPVFQRGDASPDKRLDISDPMNILNFLFAKHAATEVSCLDAADVNDSSRVDVSDAVYLFNFLFGSGLDPASPHEMCGADPTPDALDCEFYADCPE